MKKAALAIKQSGIHGHGVFLTQPIKKGKYIATLRGSKVTYTSNIHGQSNRYNNWIGIGKDTWIDPIDEFQYLNHSCNPTAGLRGSRTLKLYALRDLKAGDEVTIDYSTTESDSEYCFENLEPEGENVRKYVGSVQTLPKEVYASYLPFIPDYFKKVYEREVLYKGNES